MFKSKLYIVIVILGILSLVSGACTQLPEQAITVTPLKVPKEGSPGEYIKVVIQTSSIQPCKLVLATPHKTEIENYLTPHASDILTIPNSDGTVVFFERIPAETVPGHYILKVIQMRRDGDTKGTEIFIQTFVVR